MMATMVPVYNPPAGEVTAEVNGMFVGKSIYVFGKIHDDADKFKVNLMREDGKQNIALHINPRFPVGQVVRNTRIDGAWGAEERNADVFPFKKGGLFGIKITCMEDHFLIGANGYDNFATYSYRLPLASITEVNVGQQCDVTLITSRIAGVDVPSLILNQPQSIEKIEIPFYTALGRKIQVVGMPTSANARFSFNLTSADGTDIFHYNPRLDQKQIVRNTKVCQSWQTEERNLSMTFPFQDGAPFQTTITIEEEEFAVAINGMAAFSFTNRVNGGIAQIRFLEIWGDVKLDKITFF